MERCVSFELSMQLSKKGFDRPCHAFYAYGSAPTYQAVVEWLESKDIIIVITPYYRCGFVVYMFDIIMKDKNGDWTSKSKGDYDGGEYSTRWETLDAAIEWILANLL